MKRSLKTQLSFTILTIVLATIVIVSILSNLFINNQFTKYLTRQQDLKKQIIISSISKQYISGKWNKEYIHAIGMNSLYEGYIIKVYDKENRILWDAQAHDMNLCNQIMDEISNRMKIQYPQLDGEFKAEASPMKIHNTKIGTVSISYFGPFFLNENEFRFLHSLNQILLFVGLISLVLSALVGQLLARKISQPILKTVEATKKISDGNYDVRLVEESNTSEIMLLMESINHLAHSLQTLEKLRKQLTEDVAHELRTPITILQSHLEALSEGIWEVTPQRLDSCYDEAVRIGKLVGDLENLARIEGEVIKLNKQEIDLKDTIDKIVANFSQEAEQKNIKIEVSGEAVRMKGDALRISQVIINLISNALKYSGQGCHILVHCFSDKEEVGFFVQDNGMGIAQEEIPFIFERFYRADKSRNRMTGGAGIGLTIVKSIVKAHDGRVEVSSELNQGSCFRVYFPK